MNDQEFYKLLENLRIARVRMSLLKAEKLTLRKDRWELSDFTLAKQFDKLTEETKEFEAAYFTFRSRGHFKTSEAVALLKEIADCQNVLDGIAYLTMKAAGIP